MSSLSSLSPPLPKIIYVEHDKILCRLLEKQLDGIFDVTPATTIRAAEAIINNWLGSQFAAIIVSSLSNIAVSETPASLEFIRELRKSRPDLPIIAVTSVASYKEQMMAA